MHYDLNQWHLPSYSDLKYDGMSVHYVAQQSKIAIEKVLFR